MVEIVEVKTRKQRKAFVNFQVELYKDNKYFVPPILADEMGIFNKKKNANFEECDTCYYLAYKDGKLAGRIAGILQKACNKKMNQKYVRFSRIDFINDLEVAKALFKAVEGWAKAQGMEYVHGPLGFNDLEREGLLIEGFDELSCFEENYSYDYYPKLIEQCGYSKDVDWLEYRIKVPKVIDEKITRVSNKIAQRYGFKLVNIKSTREVINKYRDQIFNLLNECYSPLYGVVPITPKLEKQLVSQFKLIVDKKFIAMVTNDKGELIGFGLVFPSIAEPMQEMKGKLFTPKIFKLLKAVKHPKVVDTVFIAVRPDYRAKGVPAFIINEILSNLIELGVEEAESLLQLETNVNIKNAFDDFERRQHKRRRCYIKKID